jgi:hypothetical protein
MVQNKPKLNVNLFEGPIQSGLLVEPNTFYVGAGDTLKIDELDMTTDTYTRKSIGSVQVSA